MGIVITIAALAVFGAGVFAIAVLERQFQAHRQGQPLFWPGLVVASLTLLAVLGVIGKMVWVMADNGRTPPGVSLVSRTNNCGPTGHPGADDSAGFVQVQNVEEVLWHHGWSGREPIPCELGTQDLPAETWLFLVGGGAGRCFHEIVADVEVVNEALWRAVIRERPTSVNAWAPGPCAHDLPFELLTYRLDHEVQRPSNVELHDQGGEITCAGATRQWAARDGRCS